MASFQNPKYEFCRKPEIETIDTSIELLLQDLRKNNSDDQSETPLGQLNLMNVSPGILLKIAVHEKDFFKDANRVLTYHCETHGVPKTEDDAPDCLRFSRFYLYSVQKTRPFFDWERHLKTLNAQYVVKAKSDYRDRTMLKPKRIPIPTVQQTPRMKSNEKYQINQAIKKAIKIVSSDVEIVKPRRFVTLESLNFAFEETPKEALSQEELLKAKAKSAGQFFRSFSEKTSKKGRKAPMMVKCMRALRTSY